MEFNLHACADKMNSLSDFICMCKFKFHELKWHANGQKKMNWVQIRFTSPFLVRCHRNASSLMLVTERQLVHLWSCPLCLFKGTVDILRKEITMKSI